MKGNLSFLVLISLFTTLFFSCDQQSVKPSATGRSGELIVVVDSNLWKSTAGQILRDSLQADFPALPQSEPIFKLVHVQPSGFKNILQLHRNVLMVETGPVAGGKNYALTFKRNVYADPQLVLNIRGINNSYLDTALQKLTGSIIAKFLTEEQIRNMAAFRSLPKSKVSEEVKSMTGIEMPLTDDYFIAKHVGNYTWIRKETIHTTIGIQISTSPYQNDTAFDANAIIGVRDSISKVNIPGPMKGSYMTTDKTYPLTVATSKIADSYCVEVRGLWRTEGDFMGGPFLTYVILNKNKSELIYIDAFVYAPKFNKREYIKELDALVHAISF